MARTNSVVSRWFQGTTGKEPVFREWEDKTIFAKAPKSRSGEHTQPQAVTQEKLLLASRYAISVVKGQDQGIKDAYTAALRPRQNVYSRALEDFLSSPVVKSIDTSTYKGAIGDKIIVRAFDDFRVTNVQVQITAANG